MAENYETTDQIGKGPSGEARRWILELELADKAEESWREDGKRVLKRYRGEDSRSSDVDGGGTKLNRNSFNILWANTETVRPALYNSTPQPNVRRRFKDKDPVGKAVADVLERAVSYAIDAYDFDERMVLAVDDYLLPGRGVTRARYVPSFNQVEQEGEDEPVDELAYEEVQCEHVNWEDFRRGPGRIWKEVPWIAFRHKLTRDQLEEKFGDKGKNLALDCRAEAPEDDDTEETILDRAEVWEVWDKASRKVYFISKQEKKAPLSTEDDPLNLVDFFPVPRPLYSMASSTSLIPVPEYQLYETLAVELDRCTSRIIKILDGLRLRGVYDSTMSEVEKLFEKGDNKMIPAENLAKILQQGGIEKSIWMMPVDKPAQVLQVLYQYRTALIQAIYEITGVSDIFRGQSKASETAEAQRIKSNWGSLRLQRRQREIQRYARDLIRLKAEIIAENFSVETLQLMTGLEFPTAQQKQMAQMMMQQGQMQMQQMQQMQQQPPPQMQQQMAQAQELLSKPSWEEIKEVMSNDLLRQFKVDIETDSTVAEQMAEEKGAIVELMQGVVEYVNGIGPAIQAGYIPMETAKALLMAAVRRFKLGSEVEESLEDIGTQPQQPKEDPAEKMELEKQQMEMQQAQAEHKAAMERLQFEAQRDQQAMQAEMQKQQMEAERERLKHQYQMQELLAKVQTKGISNAA